MGNFWMITNRNRIKSFRTDWKTFNPYMKFSKRLGWYFVNNFLLNVILSEVNLDSFFLIPSLCTHLLKFMRPRNIYKFHFCCFRAHLVSSVLAIGHTQKYFAFNFVVNISQKVRGYGKLPLFLTDTQVKLQNFIPHHHCLSYQFHDHVCFKGNICSYVPKDVSCRTDMSFESPNSPKI